MKPNYLNINGFYTKVDSLITYFKEDNIIKLIYPYCTT